MKLRVWKGGSGLAPSSGEGIADTGMPRPGLPARGALLCQKAFVNTAAAGLGMILGPRWLSSFSTMSLFAQPEGLRGGDGAEPHPAAPELQIGVGAMGGLGEFGELGVFSATPSLLVRSME